MARSLVLLVIVLLAGVACAAPTPVRHANRDVDCIDYWPEARYRNYGYDHIVHIYNDCRMMAICDVSTNVNPNVIRVEVPAGIEVEVLTYRGSPSRDFRPVVQCTLVTSAEQSASRAGSGQASVEPRKRPRR